MTVAATTTFEVEIDLSGSLQPGERRTLNDPGHDAFVDDVEVEGVFGLRRVDGKWLRVSLTAGMDPASPCTKAFLANVADYLGDDADDALLAAGSE
jgi:hypothetical protein